MAHTAGVPRHLNLLQRPLVISVAPLLRTPAVLAGGLVCGKTLDTDLPLPPTGQWS